MTLYQVVGSTNNKKRGVKTAVHDEHWLKKWLIMLVLNVFFDVFLLFRLSQIEIIEINQKIVSKLTYCIMTE